MPARGVTRTAVTGSPPRKRSVSMRHPRAPSSALGPPHGAAANPPCRFTCKHFGDDMEGTAAVFVDGKTAATEEADEDIHPYDCCTTTSTPTSSPNAYVNRPLADGRTELAEYPNGNHYCVRSFKVSEENEYVDAATESDDGECASRC